MHITPGWLHLVRRSLKEDTCRLLGLQINRRQAGARNLVVGHLDDNPLHNVPANLKIITKAENSAMWLGGLAWAGVMPCCAVLCCAVLCCAVLCYAVLCYAVL